MEKYLIKKRPNENELNASTSVGNTQKSDSCSKNSNSLPVDLEELVYDPGLRPPIGSYDINIRDNVRRSYLQKGVCQPKGHTFSWTQFGMKRRRFNVSWFNNFDWLEYSVAKDAAFCLYCYVFSDIGVEQAFISRGFINWKDKNKLDVHVGNHSSAHNLARKACEALMNEKQQISVSFVKQTEQTKKDYHTRLSASVDCIRYFLQQGLPFRGHNESDDSINQGNFLELLKFLAEHNNDIGKVVLSNAPENLKLIAPSIQKDTVSAIACETSEEIVKEIGDGLCSVLIDESRDISTKEQMAVVLRYVNSSGSIIERFLGLVHVTNTTALSLKSALDDIFCRFGLSISKLRGQGYDDASNMKGEFNGLKTLILRENSSAFYIHCFAHQLQLILVAVAENHSEVAAFFEHVNFIMNCVVGSCKQYDALRAKKAERVSRGLNLGVIETGSGQNQALGIKRAGSTRWSSHYDTLVNLFVMFSSVLEVLENLQVDGDLTKTRAHASIYISCMQTYEFVFMLILMKNLLGITCELSDALQRKDQEIVNAMRLVQLCKWQLNSFRNEDAQWDSFLYEVYSFCKNNGIEVKDMNEVYREPRRSRRGKESKTNMHHFRIEIFNTVIDLLLNELNDRFNDTNTELLLCVTCLDPSGDFVSFDKENLIKLAKFYPDDFSAADIEKLGIQLNIYILDVRQNSLFHGINGISGLYEKLVELKKHRIYQLVCRLLKLTLLLPVATASVERVFSAMNIIKNQLRNRVGDEFMNDCLIAYIERDISKEIDKEIIMNRFQNMRSRRRIL